MMPKLQAIIRRVSRASAAPRWRRFRPFYLKRREPQMGEALVFSTGFEEGGEEGTTFPDMSGVWPAGVSVVGDYYYALSVDATAAVGKGVRFPTLNESGSGSIHSTCRAAMNWTNAAMAAAGILTRGRARWMVKIPETGGVQYRQSGSGLYWESTLWVIDDFTSLTSIVAFDTQGQLCLMNQLDRSLPWNEAMTHAILDISSYNGAGWHSFEVEWAIGASGKYKITWDDVATVEWTGDTSLNVGGIQMALLAPGGFIGADNDLSCFSGLDEVAVWRTG
jgi:hypothetical protein